MYTLCLILPSLLQHAPLWASTRPCLLPRGNPERYFKALELHPWHQNHLETPGSTHRILINGFGGGDQASVLQKHSRWFRCTARTDNFGFQCSLVTKVVLRSVCLRLRSGRAIPCILKGILRPRVYFIENIHLSLGTRLLNEPSYCSSRSLLFVSSLEATEKS